MRIVVATYHRHPAEWTNHVLASPPALEAAAAGVDLTPTWAHGAKILVPGASEAFFRLRGVALRPFHVVLRNEDVPRLESHLHAAWARGRDRPTVKRTADLGDERELPLWTTPLSQEPLVLEATFVDVAPPPLPPMTSSSADALSVDRRGYPTHGRNPRRKRVDWTSRASQDSEGPGPRAPQEHKEALKQAQRRRDLPGAINVFSRMLADGVAPNEQCYTIIIDTCAKTGKWEEAEYWLEKMEARTEEGGGGLVANEISLRCVMLACSNGLQPERAEHWHREMQRKGFRVNIVAYNLLISAFTERMTEFSGGATFHSPEVWKSRKPNFERASFWFDELLQQGLTPNAMTFAAFMNGYAHLARPGDVKRWLAKKLEAGLLQDRKDQCMLMNAYANAGAVDSTLEAFRALPPPRDVIDYSMVLKAHGRAGGQGHLAEAFFREQLAQGVAPDFKNLRTLKEAVGVARFGELCVELRLAYDEAKRAFDCETDDLDFPRCSTGESVGNHKTWRLDEGGVCRNAFEPEHYPEADGTTHGPAEGADASATQVTGLDRNELCVDAPHGPAR